MAELLPANFPIPGEGAIASYDFTDIAAGNGYVTFYLAANEAGYILTPNKLYSDHIIWHSAALADADAEIFSEVFTTVINSPRTINGKVICNLASGMPQNANASAPPVHWFFTVQLIKIDLAAAETVLGTGTSALQNWNDSPAGYHDHSLVMNVTILITNQLIKKGESLGIRLKMNAHHNGVGNDYVGIGIDPMNRTGDAPNDALMTLTQSTINIPFKIDL